jgi:hypothetical protein
VRRSSAVLADDNGIGESQVPATGFARVIYTMEFCWERNGAGGKQAKFVVKNLVILKPNSGLCASTALKDEAGTETEIAHQLGDALASFRKDLWMHILKVHSRVMLSGPKSVRMRLLSCDPQMFASQHSCFHFSLNAYVVLMLPEFAISTSTKHTAA